MANTIFSWAVIALLTALGIHNLFRHDWFFAVVDFALVFLNLAALSRLQEAKKHLAELNAKIVVDRILGPEKEEEKE